MSKDDFFNGRLTEFPLYIFNNEELAIVYEGVLHRVSLDNFMEDYMGLAFNNLVSNNELLTRIKYGKKTQEETETIVKNNQEIHTSMTGVIKTVEAMKEMDNPELRAHAITAWHWLADEKDNLLSRKQGLQITALLNLNDELKKDEWIEESIEALGQMGLYKNAMKNMYSMKSLRVKRADRVADIMGLSDGLKEKIIVDMRTLFAGIEGLSNVGIKEDRKMYRRLAQEIRKLLVLEGAAAKARHTRRKNEKLTEDNQPIAGDDLTDHANE